MLYILVLGMYDMTNTALGNAGLNVKPVFEFLNGLKHTVDYVENEFRHRGSKQIVDEFNNISNFYSKFIVEEYIDDVVYALCRNKPLNKYLNFHEVNIEKLNYYKENIKGITEKDLTVNEIYNKVEEFIKNEPDVETTATDHFVKHAQDYLVAKGTLKPEQPSEAMEVDTNMNIHEAFEKLPLPNTHKNMDSSVPKLHEISTSVVIKTLKRKRSKLEGNEHELGGLLDGGKFSKIARLKLNERRDINDSTHMSLFGILVIVYSVTATLALCVTITYYITKKQQSNTTYTAIGLM